MAKIEEYPRSQEPIEEEEESVEDTEAKQAIQRADELKQEGNTHFRAKEWDEALVSYRTGLGCVPARQEREKGKEKAQGVGVDEEEEEGEAKIPEETKVEGEHVKEGTFEEDTPDRYATTRAVLNANIAACHVKRGDHKEAVISCTQALLDDPHYIKALQRRATSNDAIDTWSSLTSAQEDYTLLLEVLPPTSPLIGEIKRTLQLLKPRVEAAQKAETGEMLDKLKGIGNSLLGNFGLSTDNFKFEPNGQGGYSMNFVQ